MKVATVLKSFGVLPVVAGVEGLEPPTPGFGDRCSGQLSYTPKRLIRQNTFVLATREQTAFATILLPFIFASGGLARPAARRQRGSPLRPASPAARGCRDPA